MAVTLPSFGRMEASLLLEPVKALLVAAAIFVPFERLAGLHAAQPAFRRGWAMDALTGVMNGVRLFAVLMAALGGVNAGAVAVTGRAEQPLLLVVKSQPRHQHEPRRQRWNRQHEERGPQDAAGAIETEKCLQQGRQMPGIIALNPGVQRVTGATCPVRSGDSPATGPRASFPRRRNGWKNRPIQPAGTCSSIP